MEYICFLTDQHGKREPAIMKLSTNEIEFITLEEAEEIDPDCTGMVWASNSSGIFLPISKHSQITLKFYSLETKTWA